MLDNGPFHKGSMPVKNPRTGDPQPFSAFEFFTEMGKFRPFPALSLAAIVSSMRTIKLQIMGGSGMKTFSHLQDLEELLRARAWTCEAVDHNSPEGCSNPKCIKFRHLLPVIDELTLRSK